MATDALVNPPIPPTDLPQRSISLPYTCTQLAWALGHVKLCDTDSSACVETIVRKQFEGGPCHS